MKVDEKGKIETIGATAVWEENGMIAGTMAAIR
jgi:hypothetical protein